MIVQKYKEKKKNFPGYYPFFVNKTLLIYNLHEI